MRQGRPRKEWTNKDIEKMEITDDVISQLKYNAGLTPEQVETLKKTLDDTLKQYNLEKEIVKDEDKYSLDNLTLENIIITLRRLNVTKLYINQDAYVPSFKRTIITDMIAKEYEISFACFVPTGCMVLLLLARYHATSERLLLPLN